MRPRPLRLLLASLFFALLSLFAEAAEAGLRTLYLVRHGFYDATPGADDRSANGLNALGREQSRLVAERLATLPVQFTSVTSSEFLRASETGDLIATRLGVSCGRSAHLNETIAPGRGLDAARVEPGSEAQLAAAWAHYSRPHGPGAASTHELLVSHSVVIRWFVCRALGVDPQHWTQMEIANGSITMIQIRPDGSVRLQLFNDFAHLPVAQQTWSGRGPDWPRSNPPR